MNLARMAVLIDGDAPPTEFRIFTAGWNASENGDFLFDAEAARLLMASYQAHGIDRTIDLEHLSLDDSAPNYDPDARGSCHLQLRGGELWAIDVRWTDDGAARLASRRQRYISPTFLFDKNRRPVKLHNIALTAHPALHGTPALVAASSRLRSTTTKPKRIGPHAAALKTFIAKRLARKGK